MPVSGGAREIVPRNNLSEKIRHRLIEHLLSGSKQGQLGKGDLTRAAEKFACPRKQVYAVWSRYSQQRDDGVVDINLRNGRGGRSGRKRIDIDKCKEALKEVPLQNRTTQRAAARQLGISQQTLHNNLKHLGIRAASRFLKPFLTEAGKRKRVELALRWVREGHGGTHVFDEMECAASTRTMTEVPASGFNHCCAW